MGNKIQTTKRAWSGHQQQWGTNEPLLLTFTCSETYDRTGSDDPKYLSKIRESKSATNSLLVRNQSVYFKPGRLKSVWTSPLVNGERLGKEIFCTMPSGFQPYVHTDLPPDALRIHVSNAANTGIIKKIRKFETSDFAGPTFVGELRETISMLKSPLRSLRLKTGLFTDLQMRILRDKQKRGKKFKSDSWRKVLSDTYLEWTFGAAPLIADISAIAELALKEKQSKFPESGLKRLSYLFSDSSFDQLSSGDVLSFSDARIEVKRAKHSRSSVMYVVWIDQSLLFAESSLDWVANAAKFRLDEIIPTAWELMPWSFLIDYWTNIGDLMGSTFNFNRNVAFGKITIFDTVTHFHNGHRIESQPFPPYSIVDIVEPHQFTSQYTRVSRESISSVGFPVLEFQLPNAGQFQNMAALMSSLAKSNPFRGFLLK